MRVVHSCGCNFQVADLGPRGCAQFAGAACCFATCPGGARQLPHLRKVRGETSQEQTAFVWPGVNAKGG